jgi:2-methylcitrate dehydratase PrpD
MSAGVTAELAAVAARLAYEQLPASTVRVVKRMLLDCLGTTLAGSALGAGTAQLLQLVRQAGGSADATVIGTGLRAPAHLAALANGGSAHALNYDDFLPGAGAHLGALGIPAALAVAELAGGVSGKELVAAIAAGSQLMARLASAIDKGSYTETRPQTSQMLGYFNAAISAGRVLRLDERQMHSALGLAQMQCSGGRQPVLEGSEAKALYAAWPNQVGVQCALLAKDGLDCVCDAFEGPAGLYATYFGNAYFETELTRELGQAFRFEGLTFKPWPATNVAYVFIEAAISLRAGHGIHPGDVASVHLIGEDHIRTFCEPAAVRRRPRTSVEAEDSVPFTVAKALANGGLGLADLQPDGLRQPEALSIAAKTEYSTDASLGLAGIVEVATVDNRRLSHRVERPLGFPPRELSDEQLAAKFHDCARHAQPGAPAGDVIDIIEHIEQHDTARLMAALRAPSKEVVQSQHGDDERAE